MTCALAFFFALTFYLQYPQTLNNPDVHQQKKGYINCGIFIQWNTTQ